MVNMCDVRMRIAAKDAESIQKFIEDVRDHGTFRVYNGIFTTEEEFDPGKVLDIDGVKAYDVAFSCKWSFVTAFEEDGVNAMFGNNNPAYDKYFHEFCKDHGVGVEMYSEESGNGFEEHYLIAPSGEILESECVDMSESYDEENDEWIKEGGFGDPDFLSPKEILEGE